MANYLYFGMFYDGTVIKSWRIWIQLCNQSKRERIYVLILGGWPIQKCSSRYNLQFQDFQIINNRTRMMKEEFEKKTFQHVHRYILGTHFDFFFLFHGHEYILKVLKQLTQWILISIRIIELILKNRAFKLWNLFV